MGVKAIYGRYRGGRLWGQGKLVLADGTTRQGWFQGGWMQGPCRGCRQDGDQKVEFIGHYRAGRPHGVCWTMTKGGGWLVGRQDGRGEYTGSGIAFLYPDLSTAIVGEFCRGVLVRGMAATVTNTALEDGLLVPSFTTLPGKEFSYWPSTLQDVVCPLHQADPYESRQVEVAVSRLEDSGEGLYARTHLPASTIVAFYNGIRVPQGAANPHKGYGYCIFVDWGKQLPFPFPWVKEGEMIDIPEKYQSTRDYSATLAHKANHTFTPNCEFTNFCHPCYGLIPAIMTTIEVARGEELTIHYNLDMKVRGYNFMAESASGCPGLVPGRLGDCKLKFC